jgi:ATP-dependent Lon protease
LVQRQRDANGLSADRVLMTDEALRDVIAYYTREAGVRNLAREIGKALRHAAVRIAEGEAGPITIAAEDLVTILGAPIFENEVAMRTGVPGVATGLAGRRSAATSCSSRRTGIRVAAGSSSLVNSAR